MNKIMLGMIIIIFVILIVLLLILNYELDREYKAHQKSLNDFMKFIDEMEKENRG